MRIEKKNMKKLFLPLILLGALASTIFVSSCQKIIADPYAYNVDYDSLAPEVSISVPIMNAVYSYGDNVAVVGTVTDKESLKNDILDPGYRAGQLKTLSIQVENLTANNTLLLNKNPDVDGLDGVAFNEKFSIVAGTDTTKCRLIIIATDAGGKTDRDTVSFIYR